MIETFKNPTILWSIIIGLFAVSLSVFFILKSKLVNIRKKLRQLYQKRENDIIETNNFFVEKSENELKIFLDFETALEEIVKMLRKVNSKNINNEELLKEIKVLLDYVIKNLSNG